MEIKEKIDQFQQVLWQDRENYQAEMPPWENVRVLDARQNNDGSFLVLATRKLQNLHMLADYETFQYMEVYKFSEEKGQITYELLCRFLFLHSYTFDGYSSLYNTRRYENKEFFNDADKQIVKIISDMKFLAESGKEVSLHVGEIEEFREFKYRYRPT
jgi:hypothetical protein